MPSSKPCKSRSCSVHHSDSESSIEYVQTQSQLGPNIPPTTPILSSMNVSGLNTDVGNPKAKTSRTQSIPNISVTPIPPNPTKTQMDVQNPVTSKDCYGQSKQPTLNIPSGSQVHVGCEKQVDGGQQKRRFENVTWSGLMEGNPGFTLHQGDELYASSPLVNKEKVSGRHPPYASKPRMGHSSSSREYILEYEDENMSPTLSERNDE
ncbi:hypothetical protein O181_073569 [Austropuccinia psidii MF-1]|uniref:Uncharacterized protein n=1 Tax=Austropuccinia psidii MF-1 TaxID=1389203 RepID=A0A9Q3F7D1_9BASI|nr:hypothetical protein [Austropuccinia psidii MF-1]